MEQDTVPPTATSDSTSQHNKIGGSNSGAALVIQLKILKCQNIYYDDGYADASQQQRKNGGIAGEIIKVLSNNFTPCVFADSQV